MVSWPLYSLGVLPLLLLRHLPPCPARSYSPYPHHRCPHTSPSHQPWLLSSPAPLRTSPTTSLPSVPPEPADGSPAVRASLTPRGTGAPGVAAESSGWGSNGGAKVPAPHTHLLRLEPHQPRCTPVAQKLGSPLHALNPARQGHQRLEDPAEISVFIALIHLSWEPERVKSSNPGNSQGRMDIELPP